MQTVQKIEKILQEKFHPTFLKIKDESARHVGHVRRIGPVRHSGGHYQVEIASALFEGKSLIEQHRIVNEALKELLETEIHALQLKTFEKPPLSPFVKGG